MSSTLAIKVEGLSLAYKKGPLAVDNIFLEVAEGEIYGFLGPNGAGKSTTVLMLTTLLPPTSGTATVGGFDIVKQGTEVRNIMGAALQEAALDPLMSGREHLMLQAALYGLPRPGRAERAEELLARVGLTEAADRRVSGYSGGMKRRLDLAMSLMHRPRVMFLDEPTTGLDPQSRTALWEEVRHLAKDEGVTVFMTTQYLEEADQLADRVGIIDRGHIVAEDTPTALKEQIGRPSVEVLPVDAAQTNSIAEVMVKFGEPMEARAKGVAIRSAKNDPDLAEIVRALDSAGLKVTQLRVNAPTLDDVFLAKTGHSLEGSGGAERNTRTGAWLRGR